MGPIFGSNTNSPDGPSPNHGNQSSSHYLLSKEHPQPSGRTMGPTTPSPDTGATRRRDRGRERRPLTGGKNVGCAGGRSRPLKETDGGCVKDTGLTASSCHKYSIQDFLSRIAACFLFFDDGPPFVGRASGESGEGESDTRVWRGERRPMARSTADRRQTRGTLLDRRLPAGSLQLGDRDFVGVSRLCVSVAYSLRFLFLFLLLVFLST